MRAVFTTLKSRTSENAFWTRLRGRLFRSSANRFKRLRPVSNSYWPFIENHYRGQSRLRAERRARRIGLGSSSTSGCALCAKPWLRPAPEGKQNIGVTCVTMGAGRQRTAETVCELSLVCMFQRGQLSHGPPSILAIDFDEKRKLRYWKHSKFSYKNNQLYLYYCLINCCNSNTKWNAL